MEQITLDLRDIFNIIKKRKYIIFVITLVFFIAGVLISLKESNKGQVLEKEYFYKSTASILVGGFPDAKSQNIKDITILNQQIVKSYGAVAASRSVAEKVINELKLDTKADEFISNVKISANPDTQVITIIYGNKEQRDVERVINKYINIFMIEAKGIYPSSELKVLDQASKSERITKEEFEKINLPQTPNQPMKVTNLSDESKNVKLIIIVSIILGLVTSFAVIFFIEYIRTTVRKKDELEVIFKKPISGIVLSNNIDECYNILRTTLQVNKNKKIFMITSPSEGDGKTTSVFKLAKSFSNGGFKTLVVDANGRNPILGNLFNISNRQGFSNIIKHISLDNTLQDVENYVNKTEDDNLHVMLWGTEKFNPADALAKADFNRLIEYLKTEFDFVILDTPSLTRYADAQILSTVVDDVIIMSTEDKTNREELFRTEEITKLLKIKTISLFWNDNINI